MKKMARRRRPPPPEKMKEMGVRRRRTPLFGAAGAEKEEIGGAPQTRPPNLPAPQAPEILFWGVFGRYFWGGILCIFW